SSSPSLLQHHPVSAGSPDRRRSGAWAEARDWSRTPVKITNVSVNLGMDFTECYRDMVSSVAAAARSGGTRWLRVLIQRGCSVDCRDNRGWTALHEAAAAGSKACVQEILSAVKGKRGCCTESDTVEPFIDCGVLVCLLIVFKITFLSKGHTEIVRILVNKCNLEAVDDYRISPLFVAAQYGQRGCLEILVNTGANANTQAVDLSTPLFIASQEGHQACVDFLLDHGADPNMVCSHDWPQFAIHAAAQFGHIGILRRLIAVTDRACDRGESMVSPVYVAINSDQTKSVELLLREGYSPDAQDCSHTHGLLSPLSLAFDESVLQHDGKTELKLGELNEMLCVALNQVHFAGCWLPLLLKAGLEPSLLLEEADSQVLNYLLEFVNWSTLSPRLKHILDRRVAEKSWDPHPYSVPCLSHICRLQVRALLGPDILMRTNVVQQLPVPNLLHDFLKFRDIPEASMDGLEV
uniref:Ankyrin repeat and SOCS box containing 3 n=1 Tax=Neolamprologus brichardi TaxID=32507 RepID=A0A3Q4I9B5_NEOBR